jgi:imidazolonepropionase-like amidohydrolase
MDTRNVNLSAEETTNRKIRLVKESELVGEMSRAGIKILAGTDLGNPYVYPGFSLHDELELLVEAGLTPMQALQTATINPAKFFNLDKEAGSIEQGKIADLVLLNSNPLENISNTKKIAAVISNGILFQRKDLDALLKKAEDIAKSNN